MKARTIVLLLALPVGLHAGHAQDARDVVVNQKRLDAETVRTLERGYGVQIQEGRYWYDRISGGWGFEGGPAVGVILPGLDLGGPLRADASRGTTSVFVNGRELHLQDVRVLQQIVGLVLPGRYWLDAFGNVGYEGGPPFMNLAAMAQRAGGAGGSTFYRNDNTGIGAGSSGGTSYVMGKDWSVIVDH